MNSEERDMIAGLFDRLNAAGVPDKDRDAERLIAQYVRQMPDSPYMLVQTVLIQEHALQQAEARIRELESQLAGPQSRGSTGSGSFLGGLRDGGRPAASVPSAGGRAMSSDQGGYAPSPWQSGPAQGQGMPQMPRAPEMPQMPPMPQQPAPSSSGGFGGFMRGALTTAAGVAGGMMIGDALRGMMGGGSHNPLGGSGGLHGHQTGSPLGGPGEKPHYQDASNNDPGGGYLASDHAQDVAQDAEIEEGWDDDGGDDDSVEA